MKLKFCKNLTFVQITNIYQLMRPYFFLYKLYGLFPYKISKNQIHSSKIGLCHTFFVAMSCIVYFVIAMYQCFYSLDIVFDTTESLMQFTSYFMLGTFIAVYSCASNKYKFLLLKKLILLSSMLSEKEFFEVAKVIYFKDIIGYIFLMGQIFNIASEDLTAQNISKMFALHITMIVFLMDMQYSNFVFLLKSCLKNVNNNLQLLTKSYEGCEIISCNKSMQLLQFNNLQLIKLRKLQHNHHHVSCVIKELNTVFTLQIIATVLMTFAEVTFGLYFFILHIQGKKGIDLDKQLWFNYFITSVTYYSLKMAVMVWICQETKNESLKTGIIVHDVILNNNNEQLKSELSLFSLQLLQCNNEFTSKCIVMNANLISGVVSGIATYLLILIQFLNTKKSTSKNNEQ
ncbi:gustatory receptor 8 [Nasonia vitripennis]|uniref:Gustatory receptor n=1 Tax=Nasonia vitripennis TaxID=7425 RepID=A0A7M6UMJ6_NASVI|nr:gustatory receptor 8 [Nasonia vitripennis]